MKYENIIKTNLNLKAFIEEIISVNWFNLRKIEDATYVVNFDEYKSIRTSWIAFYLIGNNVAYFDSFGFEYVPKEIKNFVGSKNITSNIYRIQAHGLTMCGCFCTGFVEFMLKGIKNVRLYQFNFY